jgi:hypothetical protein
MQNNQPPIMMPALISGVGGGVIASIPFIGGILLCACCAPMIGAGFVAAYLYSKSCKEAGVEFRAGRGAVIGLASGMFYAVTSAVGSIVVRMIMPQADMSDMMRQLEDNPDMPPEALEMAEKVMQFLQGDNLFLMFIVGLVFSAVLASIFATIGGAIGGAVFKVEPEVEAPPTPVAGA